MTDTLPTKGKGCESMKACCSFLRSLAKVLVPLLVLSTAFVSISTTTRIFSFESRYVLSFGNVNATVKVGNYPDGEGEIISNSASSSSSATAPVPRVRVKRYHELQEQVSRAAAQVSHPSETAYNRATIVRNATAWFKPKKICRDSCCAETVAISLAQDEHQIINTLDGHDLADVRLQHYNNPPHLKFHSQVLDERILPCLQPGTVIQCDHHSKIIDYFFRRIRPNITVPFVLVTSESDADSPLIFGNKLDEDDLLLKWYGTNPKLERPHPKFVPFPLGLSKFHPQDRYLSRYLALTNYSNPFADKSRWTSRLADLDVGDMFVKFGSNIQSEESREAVFKVICGGRNGTSLDGISCGTERTDPSQIYSAASRYLFGVSPPGAGYDCYRTYELLLLGVIPVIVYRPSSSDLFRDLPVVHMKNMFNRTEGARQNFVDALRNYIRSDAFRDGAFEGGWERMFLKYWRRKILKDAGGRDGDIVTDGEGREYYQAWRYTPFSENPTLCHKEGNCEV